MKGVLINSFKDYYLEKKDEDSWKKLLNNIGLGNHTIILATTDFDDSKAMSLIEHMADELNMQKKLFLKELGEYFVTNTSQKLYKHFYRKYNSAKEFLLNLDNIHKQMTSTVKGAKPPKFSYSEKDDKTLLMTYNSHRDMVDYFIGAIQGVGKIYNERLLVNITSNNQAEIRFQ